MAVVLSNAGAATKRMNTGKPDTLYIEVSDQISDQIKTDHEGWGEFICPAESVAIWIEKL
jgi:alpha-amylase